MVHGCQFTLCTDHKSLPAIFSSKKDVPVHTASIIQPQAITLVGYAFVIRYISKDSFRHVGALSRLIARIPQGKPEDDVRTSPSVGEVLVKCFVTSYAIYQLHSASLARRPKTIPLCSTSCPIYKTTGSSIIGKKH